MTDRFTSDDQTNCPVTEYYITEVYDGNGNTVLPADYNSIMNIDVNSGLLKITDFSIERKNWKIHLGGKNDLNNANSSPHYVVDMTHYVPFVPENDPPYLVAPIQ